MNKIHFLRACWNDCMVVESNGLFGIIDTGFDDGINLIAPYLESIGCDKLEFILITHFHHDHYGSLGDLLRKYPVGTVYMKRYSGLDITTGGGEPATDEYRRTEMANCDALCALAEEVSKLVVINENVKQVKMGDFCFDLYGTWEAVKELYENPDSPYYHEIHFGENTNSVALFADVNGTTIYLGGDAGNESNPYEKFNKQNDQYARAINRPIDLYKVPHHCCGNCLGEDAMRIFKPRYAVATNWTDSVNGVFSANRDKLMAANPDLVLLCSDRCGYAFTIGANGDLSYTEITPAPAE